MIAMEILEEWIYPVVTWGILALFAVLATSLVKGGHRYDDTADPGERSDQDGGHKPPEQPKKHRYHDRESE